MEWRYSEILSSCSQFCSRESQKSKNSETDEDERWIQKSYTAVWHGGGTSPSVKFQCSWKQRRCIAPHHQRWWGTRRSSRKEWLHAKECHLTIITSYPTLKSSIFLLLVFFPLLFFFDNKLLWEYSLKRKRN